MLCVCNIWVFITLGQQVHTSLMFSNNYNNHLMFQLFKLKNYVKFFIIKAQL